MPTIKRSIMLASILTVCAATQIIAQAQVETIPDVVYGHKDGLALTFDVLKPKANANGTAVIIMVSGGWVSPYSPPQQAAARFKDLLDKGYFPPVDLRPLARGVNPPRNGGALDRFPALNFEKEKAPDYSPIVHVSSDDPPTLLIHGDKDDLVPVNNSKIIYEAFQKNNVKTQLIIIEGAGHGFRGEDAKRANAAMVSWFEQTLLKGDLKAKP